MAITIDDPTRLEGADVLGQDGKKLGTVDAVYFDNDTDRPEWVSVKTGLFGTSVSLVPLAAADYDGGNLSVPYDKEALKTAPHHDPGRELSPQDEAELFQHYGVSYGTQSATTSGTSGYSETTDTSGYSETTTTTGTAGYDADRSTGRHELNESGTQGRDTSGPTTDNAMTRSEERLRVDTEGQEVGRARLRKHVVTEQQQVTVPVSREEVTLEREPITDANRGDAYDGPAISEEEHEVTLHAERPVVTTETEAVERVRLGTETVTEQETVAGEVRKEQIEVDADGRDVRDRR